MTEQTPSTAQPAGDRFTWHPEHAGRTAEELQSELEQQIATDQRQYRIIMDGAEEAEQDALASIVNLERRWGTYDFGWMELDPAELAGRIVAFEQERERRQEMIDWGAYRESHDSQGGMTDSGELPAAELSTNMKAISLGLVILLIVMILLTVWAL